ncbi:MAG: LysM peptidoglycan-binding domain-containing protein [Granulosicoccus sp.]|nr:LysM peptidoglycan-binding domain-containing protein [Granulosicoccus sp.]
MSNRNPALFKRSLIAVAVISLSACSTTPRMDDYDLSRVGEGILKAGRTTADVGERVWNRTTYLLGFSDGEARTDDGLLMDEVDLAMMEEGPVMPEEATLRPIVIRNARPTKSALPDRQQVQVADGAEPVSDEIAESELETLVDAGVQAEPTIPMGTDAVSADEHIGVEDLVHEVAASETLWDISRKTTGDANNWHVLADVNNLGPNAAVFPGQQLIIPADMVKPALDESMAAAPTPGSADAEPADQPMQVTQADTGNSDAGMETPAGNEQLAGTPFKVNSGETLWDFAKRTTGDATNWQAIAGQNRFSEKQAVLVKAGQTIYVPEMLVRPELAAAGNEQQPAASRIVSAEVDESSIKLSPANDDNTSAIDASTELLAEAASTLDETQPIKIVEATFKSDEPAQPMTVVPATQLATGNQDPQAPAQIMVSGTYYPKAVYNEADFSSSLLMRVSPGTTLQVSKAMGKWFQVETDKGIGYVHQRDIK